MLSRPLRLPEWCWAVAGALLLVALGLIDAHSAGTAIARGTQVYLFLIGMMALAEVARIEGLFEWMASHAVIAAQRSSFALFALVYGIGIVVTAFLSNDATAIVLTPAVLAASRRARVTTYPLVFACAFVANAASFLLPIGNPANLVVYDNHLPPLMQWMATFGWPSVAAVIVTFAMLALFYRARFVETVQEHERHEPLSGRQRIALALLTASVVVLIAVSAFATNIGTATLALGIFCTLTMAVFDRRVAAQTARGISWGIIPLVAGLFIIVEALDANGALTVVRSGFASMSRYPHHVQMLLAGGILAVACNVLNNLPVASFTAVVSAQTNTHVQHAALIAVDLSPNLSVTGSLATLLWLAVLRREGLECSPWRFIAAGIVVTIPALASALLLTG